MSNIVDLKVSRKFSHDPRQYAWSPDLEHELAHHLTQSPSLWVSVGMHLDPNALHHDTTRVIHKVCQDHAGKYGRTPGTYKAFCTHLSTLHLDARTISEEQYEAVLNLLDEYEPIMGLDDIRDQAGHHVRQRRMNDTISLLSELNAKGQDTSRVLDQMHEVQEIGKAQATLVESFNLNDDIFGLIQANRGADRLELGFPDIDARLGGGPTRGTLTTIGASTGVGKSWTFTHIAAMCLIKGLRVVYFDVEMGGVPALTRLWGWLTGLPTSDFLDESPEAIRRRDIVRKHLGPLALRQIPGGTPVKLLRNYIEEVKAAPGFDGGVDVVLVDYGDKLQGKGTELNTPLMYKTVWGELWQIAVDNQAWTVTASQLKDLDGKAEPDAGDLAWGRAKGELSDYVICLWKCADDAEERVFKVVKARHEPESEKTDPLVNQLDKCRIVKPPLTLDHLFS